MNIFRRFNISWICQVSTQVTSCGGEGGAITLSKMARTVFSVAGTTIYSSDTCFECTQFGLSRKSGVKEQTNLYLQFWKDSVHRLSKYLFLSRSIFDRLNVENSKQESRASEKAKLLTSTFSTSFSINLTSPFSFFILCSRYYQVNIFDIISKPIHLPAVVVQYVPFKGPMLFIYFAVNMSPKVWKSFGGKYINIWHGIVVMGHHCECPLATYEWIFASACKTEE